jgi:hypothetical protein
MSLARLNMGAARMATRSLQQSRFVSTSGMGSLKHHSRRAIAIGPQQHH